jgi:hypothetical protein
MHWWSETATSGTVTYKKPISLEAGSYTFDAVAQGAAGDKVTLQICDENGKVLGESTPAELDGWINWQTPSLHFTVKAKTTILLQVAVAMQDGGWGTADNLYLYEDEAATDGFVIGEEPNQPDNSGTTVTPSTSDNIVVTTKPDGSTTEIKTENATNAAGKKVEITTTTEKDATGKVTGSKVVSVIKSVAKDTTATVTVNKSAAGSVTAATATITKTGIVNGSTTKGTISATVVKQVQEAAGRKNVAMVCKVVDASGKTKFTLKANAKNLQAGQSLYLYKQNTKTGAYTMVNSKTYKVSAAGNVSVSMDTKATYELVDKATSDKITKSILATVKVAKSSRTVKKGGKITFKLNTKLNQNNVKSITYTSTKKSVATVSKSGKVTAKKAGTAKVKAKVTLKNGKTKTVSMKVTVK